MAADNRVRDETTRDSGLKSRGNKQMRSYDMIVDSGCTGYMLKYSELFSDLDPTRGGVVGNAKSNWSRIEGHGTAEFRVDYSTGRVRQLKLKDAALSPSYSHNLVSVSKLNTSGAVAYSTKTRRESGHQMGPSYH